MSSSFVDNDDRAGALGRVGALAILLGAGQVGAKPCDEVDAPNKVFGAGSSAITPTVRALAVAVANDQHGDAAERTTIFYADPSGCDGYADFVAGSTTRAFRYWMPGTTAPETDRTCEARDEGQPLDFAYLAHHVSACSESALPEGVVEVAAPVESLSLVTGLDSNEKSISAEALYLLFGFGPEADVAPWSGGTGVFPRSADSWATQLLGLAINVPADAFEWPPYSGAAGPLGAISAYSTSPAKAAQSLTYVTTSLADLGRAQVKPLAYQHYGQTCGVYPDSNAESFDKRNVRSGKYALWTNAYFFSRGDANERVTDFLGWFSGDSNPPGAEVDALRTVIDAGNVPQCAMEARRTSTLGALESFSPDKPCGCFFERVLGADVCEACVADSECGGDAPRCNFGFCEAYRAPEAPEG